MDQTRAMKAYLALNVRTTYPVATDKMRLFKSTFTPGQATKLADFQANEVSFTGYAAYVLAAAWKDGLDVGGDWTIIYDGIALFSQTAITLTDIAGGWWIEDTAGTDGKAFGIFDTPFAFDTEGNQLLIKPSISGSMDGAADVEPIFGP